MSTKVFAVDSVKVQTIVTMGIDNGMTEDAILSYVKKGFSGFDTVKLFDGSTKDIAQLVYSDLLDESAQTDILIRKYTQSAEYTTYKQAWDALDAARNVLVSIIDPDSGIGVRSMNDPELFVSAPGGGKRRAYAYDNVTVWTATEETSAWGVRCISWVPVNKADGSPLLDSVTGKQVQFVDRCVVVATKPGVPQPRAKEFTSLSAASAYIAKRWMKNPPVIKTSKDGGDPIVTGQNSPKWFNIPFA